MCRIIKVIIQISSYKNINREEVKNREISLLISSSLLMFWYEDIWIITLIILLIDIFWRSRNTLLSLYCVGFPAFFSSPGRERFEELIVLKQQQRITLFRISHSKGTFINTATSIDRFYRMYNTYNWVIWARPLFILFR